MFFVYLTFVMMTAEVAGIVHEHHAHIRTDVNANTSDRPYPAQSWDQENLKSHDNTCATMVYHNNAQGVLVQCP